MFLSGESGGEGEGVRGDPAAVDVVVAVVGAGRERTGRVRRRSEGGQEQRGGHG